ncbi:MAG: N-acetyltransferase [Desulfobacterales bacterium]
MNEEWPEPPPAVLPEDERPAVAYPESPNGGETLVLPIRPARVGDVEAILALVNDYAARHLMLPRGPQYLYENIRDFAVVVDEAAGGAIVACGSLHILWGDMAEVRSLAIHPAYQNRGLGRRIVEHLKTEALRLGIRRLFTFTLSEAFFARLGFVRKAREELPPKVWGECSRCPKYFRCDEVGMVLDLEKEER